MSQAQTAGRTPANLLVALLSLAAAAPLAAQLQFAEPSWSEADAIAAADRADLNAELRPLLDRARRADDAGPDQDLLRALKRLEDRRDLSDPARERILFDFAQALGELPPGSVTPEVTDYLLGYSPQTQVPHPDNPRVGTPLFNIRGATAGALHAWQRQRGYEAGASLLATGQADTPRRYLESVRKAPPTRRQGLLDALSGASAQQLSEIEALASADTPDADRELAARTALLLDDTDSLQRALASGRGPESAGLLAAAARELDEPGRIDLLLGLLDTATPGNAALAVGTLAPGLLQHPEVADRLFALLGDVDRGAACALVLSGAGQSAIHERLEQVAGGDDLAARRAAMALDMAPLTRRGGAP